MRFRLVLSLLAALSTVAAARAAGSGPFGIAGVDLRHAGGIAAAAFRHDGKQVVTVNAAVTGLLFWDTASGRLLDTILLDGVALPPPGDFIAQNATLKISPDGTFAAVTLRPPGAPMTTLLVDLVAQTTVARLDRPALFWTAAGLVAGPHAGCTNGCNFAVATVPAAVQTSVGAGFGNGEVVAAVPDGSRFASVVTDVPASSLVVWSTATWAPVARAPLPAGPVFETGFDRAGRTPSPGRTGTSSH